MKPPSFPERARRSWRATERARAGLKAVGNLGSLIYTAAKLAVTPVNVPPPGQPNLQIPTQQPTSQSVDPAAREDVDAALKGEERRRLNELGAHLQGQAKAQTDKTTRTVRPDKQRTTQPRAAEQRAAAAQARRLATSSQERGDVGQRRTPKGAPKRGMGRD